MKVNYKINVLIDEYEYILKRTPSLEYEGL